MIDKFVKNNTVVEDERVRNSYILLGGIGGIIVNAILSLVKLIIGFLVKSIAITADAVNNMSDAISSVITIVGFKMASKPADEEHPYGHGRIEYISALIVAFLVMLVGFEFVKSSIEKILHPEKVHFELIPFIILLISITFKLWLSSFNKAIGERIDSKALKAASVDALGDVFTSSCVVISFLVSKFTDFPVDGILGLIVALFILYSGFNLVKDTINPLLGEAPDKKVLENIKNMLLKYEHISGVHDLIIHNYGPGRCMATVHAEVPSDADIMTVHEEIDRAEREVSEKLKINLVIHMDPLCVITGENKKTYEEVQRIINSYEELVSIHDFRVVGDGDKKIVLFDVVAKLNLRTQTEQDIKDLIINELKKEHPYYKFVITVDIGDFQI